MLGSPLEDLEPWIPAAWIADRVTRLTLLYAPTHVLVDIDRRIIQVTTGPDRDHLFRAEAAAGMDLLEVLNDCLDDPVRHGLREAAQTNLTAYRLAEAGLGAGGREIFDVLVEPLSPHEPRDVTVSCPFFIVTFLRRPAVRHPGALEQPPERPDLDMGLPTQEQHATIDSLSSINRELEEAAVQMRAVNEELHGLSGQLSARNERLLTLNIDLRNLLESTRIAILYLDKTFRIRDFTNNMTELFALRDLDIGSPIGDLSNRLDYPTLQADIEETLRSSRMLEREVRDLTADPRTFLTHMRPYLHSTGDVEGVVITFVDITDRKRAEDQAWFLAHHDQLTCLPNRAMFHAVLDASIESRRTAGLPMSLLYLDLDRFKVVNDTLGHHVGDRLLQLVAARLLSCAHHGETICRLGGDEFSIIQEMAPSDAEALAESILSCVAAPYEIGDDLVQVGVSIGIASLLLQKTDADALARAADIALYEAKARGRGNYQTFRTEMEEDWQNRRLLEEDMRAAVSRHEFDLVYQPIVRLADRRIVGVEALLRWKHPRYGTMSPASFIPIAEGSGLIVPIGLWVLQAACAEAASWKQPICLSVNLSSIQFASPTLVQTINEILTATKLPPSRLALEVTETVLLRDDARTRIVLEGLRGAGIAIVMDDFGTGYSSLSYLRSFAVQKIKIDQAFIRTIDLQKVSGVIINAIVAIGDGLQIGICAEGVETEAQLAALQGWGVKEAQGYLLHRPMPPEAFSALLDVEEPVGAGG